MQLQPVKICKTDTCLTYAFKRIGHKSKIKDVADLESTYRLLDYNDYSSELQVGDILVFTQKQQIIHVGNQITADGKILSHPIMVGRHCLVYEGEGQVSDVTRQAIPGITTPTLQLRFLKEFKTRPTFLLRVS